MSTEEATSRKAKKAQRDAERKKAGKKRKREEVEEPQGEQDELKQDFIPLAGGDEATVARDSTTSNKKRKTAESSNAQSEGPHEQPTAAKSKKRRMTKASEEDATAVAAETKPGDSQDGGDASARATKSRFILFIGNLPYSATDESITAHFKSIQPFTLRHRIDPKTKKSKGFAFLEFENYDRMKTCLKLYHHSTFDPAAQQAAEGDAQDRAKDGKSGKKGKDRSRKINVELTAGGGGKGEDRKEKIKVKNAKLEEERKRRREAEEKAEMRREKKGKGKKVTGANATSKDDGADPGAEGTQAEEGMQGVHPARLARMKA